MNAKTIILAGTGLACVALLAIAWHARSSARAADLERAQLEAQRLVQSADQARMATRVMAAEEQRIALQSQLAQLAAEKATWRRPAVWALSPEQAAGMAAVTDGNLTSALLETKPELQAMFLQSYRASLPLVYGPLWRELALSPIQIERFAELMVAATGRGLDLKSAARAQGLAAEDPKLVAMWQQVEEQARRAGLELLGEGNYRRLQEFEATLPVRSTVESMAGWLALTDWPLTATQATELTKILVETNTAPQTPASMLGLYLGLPGDPNRDATAPELDFAMFGRRPARQTADIEKAMASAAKILSPPQLARLESELLRHRGIIGVFNEIRQMPDPLIGFVFGRH